ncbi:MAG: phosphocholine cytidylyltransferase family protein [Shewanellaceae bacterium]|nr:phosphocholine cytidylyltransferase family protein [Shewanellaceae bacterium]
MTKALILAAGQGTRLRPITHDKPKCLVPLMGTSLLERQTSVLQQAGIQEVHIATGYKADQIEALGFATTFNPRYAHTNMVESLFSAIDFLKACDEDLIIGYGDIVYQGDNLQKLLDSDDEISLMIDSHWRALWSLRLDNPLDDAETFLMDSAKYVLELGKKPQSFDEIQGQYTGLIKIRADKIPDLIHFYQTLDDQVLYDGQPFDNMYMTTLIQLLIEADWKVKAVLVQNGWLEVDSTDDLACYERLAHSGELNGFYRCA